MKAQTRICAVLLWISATLTSLGAGPGQITVTQVPRWGNLTDYLTGSVTGVAPAEYGTLTYIFFGGYWWPKPYFPIELGMIWDDGSWATDVVTGGYDMYASRYYVFVVRKDYVPPLSGLQYSQWPLVLPDELLTNFPYVTVCRDPGVREIDAFGRKWTVKQGERPLDPGYNYWGDSTNSVWVDAAGKLHLKIIYTSGRWYCSEVVCRDALGYGTYSFQIESPINALDPRVVVGLFIWDECEPTINFCEIDFEASSWGQAGAPNAQFVIQPPTSTTRRRFFITEGRGTTQRWKWLPGQVDFSSFYGHDPVPAPADVITNLTYFGTPELPVPPPALAKPRMNVWATSTLTNGSSVEVVISGFQYQPLAPAAPVVQTGADITTNSFVAKWTAGPATGGVGTAEAYYLSVTNGSGYVSAYSNRPVGLATSCAVTGLVASTTYGYFVSAGNAGGLSPDSTMATVTTLAAGAVSPWEGAATIGPWKWLAWFGYFKDYGNGWVYHAELGWLHTASVSPQDIWFWSPRLNAWIWTSNTVYPFFWNSSAGAWWYYYIGTGNGSGGWFHNYGTGHNEWR